MYIKNQDLYHHKQPSVFLYTKHFESVTSEAAVASGTFLKAKM